MAFICPVVPSILLGRPCDHCVSHWSLDVSNSSAQSVLYRYNTDSSPVSYMIYVIRWLFVSHICSIDTHTYIQYIYIIYIHTHIYIYIYICVCVCVCNIWTDVILKLPLFSCRGTQHFTGTVSNEATSEMGFPAWPAGRTCITPSRRSTLYHSSCLIARFGIQFPTDHYNDAVLV